MTVRWTAAGSALAGLLTVALSLPFAAGPAGATPDVAPVAAGAVTRIGSVPVAACSFAARALCGHVEVPLDRTDPASPTIGIGFALWTATSGRSTATIVAQEGGPGYPSTGTRVDYRRMLKPLLASHDLLLVDERGTGTSDALQCAQVQRWSASTATVAFQQAVGRCGDALNHRWRRADGSYVHASDLFTTADGAEDLAAVLDALHTGPVDYYGDSYGTWFGQAFASRHPELLRAVVLDSSYQVLGLDPWYRTTLQSGSRALDLVCQRSAACAAAAPGSAWARVQAAAQALTTPLTGQAPGPDGTRQADTVDRVRLLNLVSDAGFDPYVDRELDAAVRAYLAGDGVPLLRLDMRARALDERATYGYTGDSNALYLAVSCTDYPSLFPLDAPPAQRPAALAAAVAHHDPGAFAPWTPTEWLGISAWSETMTACLDWPSPSRPAPPPVVHAPPLLPVTVPVLVLGGDLDSLTPLLRGGRVVAAQMGPRTRLVVVPNSVHVTGYPDPDGCARGIVQAFLADPSGLAGLDTSCTARTTEIRATGADPTALSGLAPATPVAGGTTDPTVLRLATAAAVTAGDALAVTLAGASLPSVGLRGGTVSAGPDGSLQLAGDAFVADAPVSGTVTLGADGTVRADVQVAGPGGRRADVQVAWPLVARHAPAVVTGTAGGPGGDLPVRATLPAL